MDKLEGLRERYVEVGALLAEPEVASDPSRLRSLAKEHAELSPIVECFVSYNETMDSIEDAREILAGQDPDLRELAQEELDEAESRRTSLEKRVEESFCSPPTRPTRATCSWRFGPVPGATRLRCSPAICSGCICATGSCADGIPQS